MRKCALLLIIITVPFFEALSTTVNWVGGSSSMNTPSNWSPASVPAAGNDLVFPSGPGVSVVNDIPGGFTVGNLTINQAYTFTSSSSNPFIIPASSAPDLTFTASGTNINLSGVTLNTGGIWTITSIAGGNTITSPMSGAGNITLKAGLLILDGTNSYLGTTTIQTGATVRAGSSSTLSPDTAFIIGSGGVLDLNGNSNTIGGLAGNPATTTPVEVASSVTLGSATLTISKGNATFPFYGIISGTGGVAITGGTTSFMGTNTYSGSTSIQSGATFNTMNLGSTTSLDFSNGGGKIVFLSNVTSSIPITMSGPAMIVTNSYDIDLSGTFTGTNPLYKIGLGTLKLSGSNATGPYYVEGGTLNVNSSTIGTLPITFQTYGGILQAENPLTISQNITLTTAGTVDTKANAVGISGMITGAGDFSKSGTGTLTLAGTSNNYTGRTIINEGTLNIPSASYTSAGSQLLFSGTGNGIFQTGTAFSPFSSAVIFTENGTIDTNGVNSTISGIVAGSSTKTFTKSGSGILNLSGANTFKGSIVVSSGTLQAGVAQVSSTNSCSGLTEISSGAFGVGANITVNPGTILDFQTYANTVGILTNTGTVSTSATISATSYSQASDLILDFPTSSATPYGNVTTSAAISLSGDLTVNDTGNYIPTPATEIVLLQSSGSGKQLSGSFANVTLASQFSSIGKVQYDYSENKVILGTSTSNGYWQTAASGNWDVGANWVGGVVPGVGSSAADHDAATFPDLGAGSFTVTLANSAGTAPQSVTLHDLTFSAGATVYTIQQYDATSQIIIDKATTGSSKPRISMEASAGATINAPIVLNTDSRIYLSSGTLTFGSSTTVHSTASTLYVSEGATSGTLINTGSITPYALILEGGTIQNSGMINPATSLIIAGLQGIATPLTLTNSSTITAGTVLMIGGGGGTTNVTNTGTISSFENLTVNSGTIANNSGGLIYASSGKTLTISGGTLTNANGASLGLSSANLTVSGGTLATSNQVLAKNYTQGASGTLSLDFPTNMATPVGSISAVDTISLNGTLTVLDTGNFIPSSGTEIVLLVSSGSGKQLSGTFSSISLPAQFSSGKIHYDYSENKVILGVATNSGTWLTAGNGNWADSANWVGGTVPGVGSSGSDQDTATFPDRATSQITVTLATAGGGGPQSVTLHDIVFNSTNSAYTIQQYSTSSHITLDRASMASSKPRISMLGAAGATIHAPLVLNSDSRIYLSSGTLTLGSTATVNSVSSTLYISEGSSSGTLVNHGSMTPHTLIMEGGIIQNSGTMSPTTALTIAAIQGILTPLNVTNSGTMSAGTTLTIGASGEATTVTNSGTIHSVGDFTIGSGSVTNQGSGVLGSSNANLIFSGGTLINSGKVLASNYSQNGTSNLQLNVTNSSTFGHVTASGTGSLGGSLIVNAEPGFSMNDGESVTLIKANQGLLLTLENSLLQSTFSSQSFQNFPSSVVPSILYLQDSVVLDIRKTIAAHTNGGSTQVAFTTVGQHNALITQKAFQMRNRFQKTISQSTQNEGNQELSFSDESLMAANDELTQSSQVELKQSQLKEKIEQEELKTPWNVYLGPIASFGRVKSVQDQIGMSYSSVGGLTGVDYVFPDSGESRYQSGIGAIIEYRNQKMSAEDDWGTTRINRVHGSLYGSVAPKVVPNLAFDAIVGFAYNWDHMNRNAGIGKSLRAIGKTNEKIYDFLFDLEYTIYPFGDSERSEKNFSVTPLANVQYVMDQVDGYTEKGAGIYDLRVDSQTPQSLTTTLGTRIDYTYRGTNFSIRTELDAGWQYQYLDLSQVIGFTAYNFTGQPTLISTIAPGKNSLLLSGDLLATFSKGWHLEATVNYHLNSLFYDLFFYFGAGKDF